MKPMNQNEIQGLVDELNGFVGAQLQSVHLRGTRWSFELYLHGKKSYLILDLRPKCPVLFVKDSPPQDLKKTEVKPALLFIKSRFIGAKINSASLARDLGRVLKLNFSNAGEWEIRLFPQGINFILQQAGKKISLKPVKTILQNSNDENYVPDRVRSSSELMGEYESAKAGPLEAPGAEVLKLDKIKKIEKAIQKIKDDLQEKSQSAWLQLGNLLKEKQTLKVSSEFDDLLDQRKSLAWNIENVFRRHKSIEQKAEGTRKRLLELEGQMSAIKNGELPIILEKHQRTKIVSGKVDGRHQQTSTGHLIFIGRKAQENLKVLRAAKAWDYWFHLRDYPGAHAVLRRNKNEIINDKVLHEVGESLLLENFRSKPGKHKGELFDIMVAEVRFVRPIKGDKLGRVTYSQERVIRVRHP